MVGRICCLLVGMIWLVGAAQGKRQGVLSTMAYQQAASVESLFNKALRFNVYTFTVTAADTGRVREVQVKAYRGELLLTNFQVRVDGAVTGAEVADLDNNRFPELYVYSTSDGSGSFGRVYGWQFLPERKADITPANWRNTMPQGYMGHDSLWVEQDILCRKFPIYQPGDANAEPSGGYQMMRYKLQPAGAGFSLIAE
ncbi:hypothetical protein SD10_04810 [Spirosoma radiotolerans]|uniref:Uncharacterized protein n=2 Tax=Spirosoma radiotolerans TaxID=1379870 RepID=A0A0E3ZU26_9BACT|nr:hypothetical protein SD10_04810 [Spirosoma radiotolerans]